MEAQKNENLYVEQQGTASDLRMRGIRAEYSAEFEDARNWYIQAAEAGDTTCWYEAASVVYIGSLEAEGMDANACMNYYLLRGAVGGDRRALVELAHYFDPQLLGRFFRRGLLDPFRGCINLDSTKIKFDRQTFTDVQKKEQVERQFSDWAQEALQIYAKEGDGVAQYYLGMDYAQAYSVSTEKKRITCRESAQNMLNQARKTGGFPIEVNRLIERTLKRLESLLPCKVSAPCRFAASRVY